MASYSEPYVSNGTGVFWDMDECKIPEGRTEADLVPFIRQMLLDVGLRGPVSIRIYGDLTGLDFQASEDVKLNQFHAGEKREKMTKILEDIHSATEDIVAWSGENPEPSLGVLVLGHLGAADDADITEVTELLKTQKNYHFVFATPGSPPPTVVRFLRAIPRGGL
ncbi:unnamed protein product [Brassica rapa]|uniref:NYN domain-containing protein n=1 Tax=Brassica campestris TaxID=3711 RepID=A0A3P5YHS3_BRACM|nr:unnamed protein product [Brassica rapa]VDC63214.1 unnamed protein product [Brassica rapa]